MLGNPKPNRGFTLLEVILALGLTVVLLAAISTALDLYARVSTAGRDATERAQVARALFRLIERDLQCIVYRPPEPDADDDLADTTTDEESLTDESTQIGIVDPADAYAGSSIGLFGDAQTLVLHISRPLKNLNYTPLLEGSEIRSRSSDLQSVSYFLAIDGAGGLQGMVADGASGNRSTTSRDDGNRGLARMEGDRMSMDRADQTANLEMMAGHAGILAPEVDYLAFRYFDGIQWWDTWNSVATERLPRAVEISLGLRSESHNRESPSQHLFRYVVAPQLADPTPMDVNF